MYFPAPCRAAPSLTSAPKATRVSMRTAVSTVMCRQPAIRAPFSGLEAEYISRIRIKPGISFSAMSRALRPQAARLMSAAGTGKGGVCQPPCPTKHCFTLPHVWICTALTQRGLKSLDSPDNDKWSLPSLAYSQRTPRVSEKV